MPSPYETIVGAGPSRSPSVNAAGKTALSRRPNVATRDGRAGVQTGELLVVTEEQGPRRVHKFPRGLHQAGGT